MQERSKDRLTRLDSLDLTRFLTTVVQFQRVSGYLLDLYLQYQDYYYHLLDTSCLDTKPIGRY